MNFTEFKNNINMIDTCEPVGDWSFDKIITLLRDVELNFDAINSRVDDTVNCINKGLEK